MDASDPIRPSKKLLWHGGRPHMGPGARPGRRQTKVRTSRVAAVFAEQVELLLHRAVGEAEQNRIIVGLVGDPVPARHHEQVARTPLKGLLADPRAALALDRREYGGVGRAIARGLESLRHQLD